MSAEVIDTWIYALQKGELAQQGILLRTGRAQPPRSRTTSPGARIVGMTSIDARPTEASDRAVPGHWGGELLIGKPARPPWPLWWSAPPATPSRSRCSAAATPPPPANTNAVVQ